MEVFDLIGGKKHVSSKMSSEKYVELTRTVKKLTFEELLTLGTEESDQANVKKQELAHLLRNNFTIDLKKEILTFNEKTLKDLVRVQRYSDSFLDLVDFDDFDESDNLSTIPIDATTMLMANMDQYLDSVRLHPLTPYYKSYQQYKRNWTEFDILLPFFKLFCILQTVQKCIVFLHQTWSLLKQQNVFFHAHATDIQWKLLSRDRYQWSLVHLFPKFAFDNDTHIFDIPVVWQFDDRYCRVSLVTPRLTSFFSSAYRIGLVHRYIHTCLQRHNYQVNNQLLVLCLALSSKPSVALKNVKTKHGAAKYKRAKKKAVKKQTKYDQTLFQRIKQHNPIWEKQSLKVIAAFLGKVNISSFFLETNKPMHECFQFQRLLDSNNEQ